MSVTFRIVATIEKVIRNDEDPKQVKIEKVLDAPLKTVIEVPHYSRACSIIGDLKL
jgi:hypothetical protein